jgi:hypothetical protein
MGTAPEEIKGYWSAGIINEDGRVSWIKTGHTSKAGIQSWLKRKTAAAHANELLAKRKASHESWREGSRHGRPIKPLVAVVGSPANVIELADVERPDATSYGCDVWWAVLKPGVYGMRICSLHVVRSEAAGIANECGGVLGIASTPIVTAYKAERLNPVAPMAETAGA